MKMKQRVWINPLTKKKEIVFLGDARDLQLSVMMNSVGLYDMSDGNKPENVISMDKYLKQNHDNTRK